MPGGSQPTVSNKSRLGMKVEFKNREPDEKLRIYKMGAALSTLEISLTEMFQKVMAM